MFSWTISSDDNKSAAWYISAGVISLTLIIWGFFIGLYVMSIVVFIFAGVYILMENNAPEYTNIGIDENGISINTGFYDYASIEEFSIIYDQRKPILLRLRVKKRGMGIVDIEFTQDINTAELRAYLLQYIKESEKGGELTSTEKLTRYLKI